MSWQKTEDPFNIKPSSYSQANIILPKAIVLNIHAHFKDQDCEQNGTLNLLSIYAKWTNFQYVSKLPISYKILKVKGLWASQITEFENLTPGPKSNSEHFQPSEKKYNTHVF